MYLQRTCKRLGPLRVRRSKYSLLLLLLSIFCRQKRGACDERNSPIKEEHVESNIMVPAFTQSQEFATFQNGRSLQVFEKKQTNKKQTKNRSRKDELNQA